MTGRVTALVSFCAALLPALVAAQDPPANPCQPPAASSATPAPESPTPPPAVISKKQKTVDQDQADLAPPVDWNMRIDMYLKSLIGPGALVQSVASAVVDEVRDFPHEWHRSGLGFEKRLGSEYGQVVISNAIQMGFSAIHSEDPRYYRMGQGNPFKRTFYAITSSLVVTNTHGGREIALGEIAGSFGSWAIATRWNPPSERTGSQILLYGGAGIVGKSLSNTLREFWPDVHRLFKRNKP